MTCKTNGKKKAANKGSFFTFINIILNKVTLLFVLLWFKIRYYLCYITLLFVPNYVTICVIISSQTA